MAKNKTTFGRPPRKPGKPPVPTKWKPPEDMHPRLAKLVLEGKACGAKICNGEGYCAGRPVLAGIRVKQGRPPPYRCKYHGGYATGAPVGNQNARKMLGVYADGFTPEELAKLPLLSDDVQTEVNMLRLRIQRIVQAQLNQDEALGSRDQEQLDAAFLPAERTTKRERPAVLIAFRKKKGGRPGRLSPQKMIVTEETIVKKAPDLQYAYNMAMKALQGMLDLQHRMKGGSEISDDRRKELMRQSLAEMDKQEQGDDE